MRTTIRALLVVWVAVLALFGAGIPAAAHNVLISSDPAEGEQLDTGPDVVTLTFDQHVQKDVDTNEVAVTGPDGNQWAEGTVEIEDNVVTAPLRPLGPSGEYTIGYRILSADGHPVSEEIRFTLTTPGTGTPAADSAVEPGTPESDEAATAADSENESGVPLWVWVVGAAVLLVLGVAVALRMGRQEQ